MNRNLVLYSLIAFLTGGLAYALQAWHNTSSEASSSSMSATMHWSVALLWGVSALAVVATLGMALRIAATMAHSRPLPVRLGLTALIYTGLLLGFQTTVWVSRTAVFHPNVRLDFDNIFNLTSLGLVALLGAGIFSLILFLMTYRTAHLVRVLSLPMAGRLGMLLLATFLTYLTAGFFWPKMASTTLAIATGFGLVSAALYHYVASERVPPFLVIVMSLFWFSSLLAITISVDNSQRHHLTQTQYAQTLANKRDTAFAEPRLRTLATALQNDATLANLLHPYPLRPQREPALMWVKKHLYQEPYLYQYFRPQIFAFETTEHTPLFVEQREDKSTVVDGLWNQSTPIDAHSAMRFGYAEDGSARYWLRLEVPRMQDPAHMAEVYIAFDQQFPSAQTAYAQLFNTEPFENLPALAEYDYAVRRQDKLLVEYGQPQAAALQADLQPAELRTVRGERRTDVVARSADGSTTAVVGRALGAWYKPFYLFSILFAIASGAWFLVSFLNAYLHILPNSSAFAVSAKGSLSKRINYANMALLALGFLVIGILTYRHFNEAARQNRQSEFEKRLVAVQTFLRSSYYHPAATTDSLQHGLSASLHTLANSLALDVNLYDATGHIQYSTREDLRQVGKLASTLPADVLQTMRISQTDAHNRMETVQGKAVNMRYLPLHNAEQNLLGIIGAPYPPSAQRMGPEVANFLGMLAALYVCLLLIAVSATLWLAGSITRPLQLVADRIKEVQFQGKNELLEYRGDTQDEIGALVGGYNRMVEKLEDSKSKLIRFERDSAWREMARQIAHDIKNPLTTMKLSMQQLERVSNEPNPIQFASYLKKAIARLIEQIDSLAQIASEFSMFANIEIRQKDRMTINTLVESVFYLFSEQREVDLQLRLPANRIFIDADKNHLIRVLNNLIINSIQAIPAGREGVVTVSVYERNQQAIIQISDNGGGIPEQIQGRVFEPNFTTKSSGSGLGLAICKKIVEAHDGTIYFETRENVGTDFYVELPLAAIEAPVEV